MIHDMVEVSPFAGFLLSFSGSHSTAMQLAMLAFAYFLFLCALVSPAVALISFIDRKVAGDIQMRIGPNRSGAYGLPQGLADTIKFFLKIRDDFPISKNLFFYVTIGLSLGFLVMGIVNIPFSSQWVLTNIDLSALFAMACILVSRLFLFWSAYVTENAWSTVSAFGMISIMTYYVAPMALALLSPSLVVGSMSLQDIAKAQGGLPWEWMVFKGPGNFFSFLVFGAAVFLWHGRSPSNLFFEDTQPGLGLIPEFEGRRLFLLRRAEHLSIFLACGILVTVFLGAWKTPFSLESFGRAANLVEALFFLVKTVFMSFFLTWFRWTMPQARLKQLSRMGWRTLLPFAFLGASLTAVWLVFSPGGGVRP